MRKGIWFVFEQLFLLWNSPGFWVLTLYSQCYGPSGGISWTLSSFFGARLPSGTSLWSFHTLLAFTQVIHFAACFFLVTMWSRDVNMKQHNSAVFMLSAILFVGARCGGIFCWESISGRGNSSWCQRLLSSSAFDVSNFELGVSRNLGSWT